MTSNASLSMRVDWDTYFMRIANEVSTRATCDRRHVGAVLVRSKAILATGYNGSLRGQPHCDDAGHMMVEGHCELTIHAEANAIVQAASLGIRIAESSLYVTTYPCYGCFKLAANAGVGKVYYTSEYVDKAPGAVEHAAHDLGIELVHMGVVERPIDMILPCPRCHRNHVDAPEPAPTSLPDIVQADIHVMIMGATPAWTNPPHKSHMCHYCKWIWRPADVYTNGVATIATRGKHDS